MSRYSDRAIVVTGGAGGLGGEVVRELLRAGATCHVPLRGDAVPDVLASFGDQVRPTTGIDLTDEAATRTFYESLPDLWGSVHLAGGFAMSPLEETTLAEVERLWRLNAVTAFLCCREAARRMPAGGRIVNVGARPAVTPVAGMIAYSMAKAVVAAMTRALAEELRHRDILVNAVLPSIIDTPANRAAMPDAPFDAWPTPAQVAKTIDFLMSPDNELTSGALVPVYGRA